MFCVGSQVRHETSEESRRIYRPKRCEYNNEDKDDSPNILSDKNLEQDLKLVWLVWFGFFV